MGERDLQLDAALGRPSAAARPCSRSRGASSLAAGDLDLAQRQRSAAQRLQRSLLGGEAGREVASGPMPRARVGQLALGEQPFGEPRPPLERPLEPSNLEQIDPDPGGSGSGGKEPLLDRDGLGQVPRLVHVQPA